MYSITFFVGGWGGGLYVYGDVIWILMNMLVGFVFYSTKRYLFGLKTGVEYLLKMISNINKKKWETDSST